ncbi:hypothetical protein [Virgibacillus salexigens]|uniref:hypothetical protein n=1 Tax=Virgibacillus salexigens TaxID=61016 RepID=UPI00190DF573|nr:hypothetical protein [Virgibacillus salexigens]
MENTENKKNHSFSISSNVSRNNSNENVTINDENVSINDEELEKEIADYVKATIGELKANLNKQKEDFKSLIKQNTMNQKEIIKTTAKNTGETIGQNNKKVQNALEEEQNENEE